MKPSNYPQSPKILWDIFYDFTQTPRPSKKEEKIRNYLIELAKNKTLSYSVDTAGNVVIYVPGKNGREEAEPVLIQNHIDMVTDALPEIKIDFSIDPIETYVDGEWLKARGTTLGADNGIGCAASLAPIFDDELIHPPLELLFTVDEETGLHGALGLDHSKLSAKKMLNLDTEEWGSLYIGCAGGIDYELQKEIDLVHSELSESYDLLIDGFIGGHSGVDIHEQRANALKFFADILNQLLRENIKFELSEIRGGKAHNIIPRDCFASINLADGQVEAAENIISRVIEKWKSFLPKNDQEFRAVLKKNGKVLNKVLSTNDCRQMISLMNLFPHGVHAYDLEDRSLVSMSNNFARFLLVRGKLYIQSSLRFFDREEVRRIEDQLHSFGSLFDLKVESHSEYPSWKPSRENALLDDIKMIYKESFQEEAHITAIHAGLECGILRDKIGAIDVVSFGPTIMGAHSPDERIHIPSVEKFWLLFKNILEKI